MVNSIGGLSREGAAQIEPFAARPTAAFSLHPHDDPALDLRDRDAALWTLVDRLAPEECLTIGYGFDRETRLASRLSVSLAGRSPVWGGYETIESAESETRRALVLAFPGFLALPAEPRSDLSGRVLRAPGTVLCLPPGAPVATRLGPRALIGPGDEVLTLGPRGGKSFHLDVALAALARSGVEGELLVAVRRFEVSARVLRGLERAMDLVTAAPAFGAGGLLSFLAQARVQQEINLWQELRTGVQVSVTVSGPAAGSNLICGALERLLWGAAPGVEPRGEIDLSDCFPAERGALPFLTPRASTFKVLGFRDQAMARCRDRTGETVLGSDLAGRKVGISRRDCGLHTYVIGATGVGKSTLIGNMVHQDIAAGRSVIVIDPHGDLFSEIRDSLSSSERRRAVLADGGDFANPFGLNLLEIRHEPIAVHRNFVANQLIGVFKSVLYRDVPEAFGPMFEAYFRNALLLLMDAGGAEATLADFDRVFGEPAYRRELLERCSDASTVRFWRHIAANAGGDVSLENIAPYICSKLTQLTGNALLRPIVTARKTTLDFETVMQNGCVCLVNLAKGLVGEADSALLGGLIVIRLFSVAMARAALPPSRRAPVRVYLDEFPTYAGQVLSQMLAECRKFGIELVLANQGLGQIDDARSGSAHAILANVANVLAFRTGPDDARRLAEWFGPEIDPLSLTRLPDHTLVARLIADGTPRSPTRVRTSPPPR